MDATRRLPRRMVGQLRDIEEGRRTPVEPRDAATVVLLRAGVDETPGALEVYLLRRHAQMAFAAGMCVFPGGGVDPRDFDREVGWVGPSAAEWAVLLGTDEQRARALVCAAVRETFEESGVLLAGPTRTSLVEDTSGPGWEEDRRRLEGRELAFTDFLARRGLSLRTDLLRVWGSWLTPVFEPRRFRAWFFVAELPSGQETRDVSTESQDVTWMPVRDAIRAVDEERLGMLPPTYVTCLELYDVPTPEVALAAAADRDQEPVEPTAVVEGEDAVLVLPERLARLGSDVHARLSR